MGRFFEEVARLWRQLAEAEAALRVAKQAAEEAEAQPAAGPRAERRRESALSQRPERPCEALQLRLRAVAALALKDSPRIVAPL